MNRIKRWIIREFILGNIKKAAEGGHGPGAKALYWWLEGKKTYLGLGFAGAMYGLNEASIRGLCDDCLSWAAILAGASLIFFQAGILDEALRFEPPKKD